MKTCWIKKFIIVKKTKKRYTRSGDGVKYFSVLIKPASSKCNINCKYCFYSDVANLRNIPDYGIMSHGTSFNLINSVFNHFKEEVTITFAFQGGEPTIAGLSFFRDFVNIVKNNKEEIHHINYAIQTNGTLLNEDWCVFLKENNFLVGVSLDGFMNNHDAVRVRGINGKTYEQILKNIELLRRYEIEFNILTVLTSRLSKEPKKLFNFYLKHDFKYIQLIPCLPALDNIDDYFALKPKEFYSFYNEFFKCWLKEYKNNNYISVTYFDNIIPLFIGRYPSQCGYLGNCSMQFVIESDGSVYPCDFYVLDKYKVGNVNENSILDLIKSSILNNFINEKRVLCNKCSKCRYKNICNGQCKRMSVCYYDENYCGLYEFMHSNEKELIEIANSLK